MVSQEHSKDGGVKLDHLFFSFLLFLGFLGVGYILVPFLHPIIFGILIATVAYPIHGKILKLLGNRKMVAAVVSTSTVVSVFLIPTLIFLSMVINQGVIAAKDGLKLLDKNTPILVDQVVPGEKQNFIEGFFAKYEDREWMKKFRVNFDITPESIEDIHKSTLKFFRDQLSTLSNKVVTLFTKAGGMVFNFLITVLVLFYLFLDGEKVLRYLLHLSPLPHKDEQRLLDRIKSVNKSAIQGTFFTACCHGLVSVVSLAIVGLPALFLGTLIAVASVVPVVGTALVLVPLIIYLLVIGKVGSVMFIIIWWAIFNNIVDYIIRPILMRGEEEISPVLLLFSIMGGVTKFGLAGFLYGPLLLGVLTVLLWIYEDRNRTFLSQQDATTHY